MSLSPKALKLLTILHKIRAQRRADGTQYQAFYSPRFAPEYHAEASELLNAGYLVQDDEDHPDFFSTTDKDLP